MSQDIRPALAGWDFEPERVQVRIISAEDGTEKIQMRIDLGLIQMEIDGRPDGERPQGFESLLELYETGVGESVATGETFSLRAEDCALLMREGIQYYHRYVAAFQLERYDLVEREHARNLRLFAFVARYAARQRDRMEFEQYRPYVQLMYTSLPIDAGPAPRRLPRRAGFHRRGNRGHPQLPHRVSPGRPRSRMLRAAVPPPVASGDR